MAAIVELFRIPKDLTVEFLGTFARFEYALKRSGYAHGNENQVTPDWDRLGRDLASQDAATLAPILECCPYLRNRPPMKQVLENGRLAWKARPAAGSEIETVLLSVRTVRNNVFHGGKFPDGLVGEPLRDELLIRDCLAVLKALLASPNLPADILERFQPEV
jgi:hypothetical protein